MQKIQVKSLEKLISKKGINTINHNTINNNNNNNHNDLEKKQAVVQANHHDDSEQKPSKMADDMDALDLTKKRNIDRDQQQSQKHASDFESRSTTPTTSSNSAAPDSQTPSLGGGMVMPNFDVALFEKSHQMLMAQQQFFNDNLPKIDANHYVQNLYRSLLFPGSFPFLIPNALFAQPPPTSSSSMAHDEATASQRVTNPMLDIKNFMQNKEALMGAHMSGGSGASLLNPANMFSGSPNSSIANFAKAAGQGNQSLLGKPNDLAPDFGSMYSPAKNLNGNGGVGGAASQGGSGGNGGGGSVKMVIKNGVLMPKQKQRRYRTERPFACEHCSARFTLRSNMERHIKQQHPQHWAQRQRSGHHLLRRGGAMSHSHCSSPIVSPAPPPPQQPSSLLNASAGGFANIPEEVVKYAILAQQLNRDFQFDPSKMAHQDFGQRRHQPDAELIRNAVSERLKSEVMNEEEDDENYGMLDGDNEENDDEENAEEEEDAQLVIDEDFQPEEKSQAAVTVATAAKKMVESLLMEHNMMQSSDRRKEEADLASISKLVDNATSPFNNFFRTDRAASAEQSDEDGLVAPVSASESNQSGPDEDPAAGEERKPGVQKKKKKKSAYSLAPNRVRCSYCRREFPWSSSLRRHILTHTGQKPFKCSHCPLLFTTKSNCDRHLLRKHGNVESAVSLYMPIEETDLLPEPIPVEAVMQAAAAEATATVSAQQVESDEKASLLQQQQQDEEANHNNVKNSPRELGAGSGVSTVQGMVNSDLPFKCHLCDASFPERFHCLDHIKGCHTPDYELLVAKGAIEMDPNPMQSESAEDDERSDTKGKYPDYANRKVSKRASFFFL